MIDVSISYGFGDDNRYNLDSIPKSIQLALYKYDQYMEYRDEIYKDIERNNTTVVAVHAPLDICKLPQETVSEMLQSLSHLPQPTINLVVHPNKGIEKFADFIQRFYYIRLCIEVFGWKSNKVLRSPFDIIEFIIDRRAVDFKMVIDTSHMDEVWFDHRILPTLLKYTNIIHLSNRAKGVGQHLPFNDPRGDLNLVKFVKDLKHRYNWNGHIVLEYMEEYKHKLLKNVEYLNELLK